MEHGETQGVSATAVLHNGGQGAALMSAAWIALQNVGVQPVADLSAQPSDEQAFTLDPEAGVVDFVAGDVTITPGVRLELAPGHTADHCVLRLQDGGETALFLADLAQRPVQLERLAWIAAYDVLPLVSLETKRRIATEAAQEGHLLIFQHHPAVGRLVATERGWQFVPEPLPTEAAR